MLLITWSIKVTVKERTNNAHGCKEDHKYICQFNETDKIYQLFKMVRLQM